MQNIMKFWKRKRVYQKSNNTNFHIFHKICISKYSMISCRLDLIHQNHSDILKLDLGIVILLLLDIGKGIRLFSHIIFIGIRQIYVCFCLIYIYLYFFYFWFVWRFMITVSIFYCLFQPFFLANKLHFSFC